MLRMTLDTYYWSMSLGLADPVLWFFWVMIFLFGSCWGSFLNVCIWRIPRGESVRNVPSHCPKCNAFIRWYDNIPLWSWTVLRGRCRACGEPISPRYVLVELATGLLFLGLFLKVQFSGQPPAVLPLYYVMTMLCVTTVFIDAKFRIIPDATTYPAILIGAVLVCAFPEVWGPSVHYWRAAAYTAISAAVAGLVLWFFAALGRWLFKTEALGWGDVKFMIAAAVLLGLPGAFFTLLAGSFSGLVYGVGLTLWRWRSLRKAAIPFGPFLAAGAVLWMFAGDFLLQWYLTIAGVLTK